MKMRFLLFALLLCLAQFAQPQDAGPDAGGFELPEPEVSESNDPEDIIDQLEEASGRAAQSARALLSHLQITHETCAVGDLFDLMAPAALVLVIISAGLAIFYMAGNFFQSPQIIAMSKQEAFELVHTALIVVLFTAFYGLAQGIMGTAGLGPNDIYTKAMEYSMVMVEKITEDIFWLSVMNTLLYMLYSAPLRMGGALHMAIHFNLGGVLKPFVDGVGTMASLLSFALGEWIVNLVLLCYIKKYMLSLLLPIGVILKSFPQTRGGGNAIIALSIAFFLVYPMMLVMNYQAYEYRYGVIDERSGVAAIASDFLLSSGIWTSAIFLVFMQGILKTIPGILMFSWGAVGAIDLYADVIYTVFVLSIFLPLLNIFVTLTFAREIAKYFGTEINIAAFVKLV